MSRSYHLQLPGEPLREVLLQAMLTHLALYHGPRSWKGLLPLVSTWSWITSWPLLRTLPGPFRIYRAPRSVAFLSCGSALQPILRKSQCWCIDEVNSKFILQIRRPNYWRIEVPVDDPEDQQRAEELREVLNNVLQFEKTECPFKRTFTVDQTC